MTQTSDAYLSSGVGTGSQSTGSQSTTDTAKEQAGAVGQSAVQAGQQVAGTAKESAAQVAGEAASQARDLLSQAQEELRSQAGQQQDRLAGLLRSLHEELSNMASGADQQQGLATDLVRQAADRTNTAADWFSHRQPGDLLDEVKGFARRRPGAFLGIAAGLGLLAGRLSRGVIDETRSSGGASFESTTGHESVYMPATATAPMPTPTPTAGTVDLTAPPLVPEPPLVETPEHPVVFPPASLEEGAR